MSSDSKENLISPDPEAPSRGNVSTSTYDAIPETNEYVLTTIEKKFLLSAERGDCAGVRR